MQTNAQECHCLTQDAHIHMNGLIYNCLPSDVIFNFSLPISVEHTSILDHLGFLFCFAVVSLVSKCCLFQLISQRIGLHWSRLILFKVGLLVYTPTRGSQDQTPWGTDLTSCWNISASSIDHQITPIDACVYFAYDESQAEYLDQVCEQDYYHSTENVVGISIAWKAGQVLKVTK